MVHGVRVGGGCVRARLRAHGRGRARQARAHGPGQHGGGGARHGGRRHGRRGVEAVDGVLVVVGGHHGPEGLGAQRAGDLRGPVVVAVGRVQAIGVAEGGHQAVELGAEASFELGGGAHCVHGIALAFSPFGSSVLEPHL